MTRKYKWRPWVWTSRSHSIAVHPANEGRVERLYKVFWHPGRVFLDGLEVQSGWKATACGREEIFPRRCQAKRWVEWMLSLEAKR